MFNEKNASPTHYKDITPEELEEQKKFVQSAETILRSFKKYCPKYDLLDELMHSPPKFTILEPYAENLLQDMSEWFQAGITQRHQPHSIAYMAFIKYLYMMFVEPQKSKFAGKLIYEWQRMELDHSTYFENISADYDKTLNQSMDVLYYAENPEEMVDGVKDELRWAMIISPLKVVYRMLYTAIHRLDTLTASLKICRMVPQLFYEKDLKMWHRKETEVDQKEPLLTLVLRRMIADSRSYLTKSVYWNAIEVVAMSLCQRVEGEKKPLMDQHSLLNLMLDELYARNRKPLKCVEVVAKIASLILSLENPNELVYKFAGSMRAQPEPMLFLTPTIFDLILDQLSEHDGKSRDLCVNLKIMLRSIGKRMEHAGARFDEETRDYIFSKPMPWYVEYAVTRWYSFALDVSEKRVPPAIYEGLDEREIGFSLRDDNQPCGNHQEDFIMAIVELGLFDVDSALDVLRAKRTIRFDGLDVPVMLDKAVHASFGRKVLSDGVENWQVGGFFYEILHLLEVPQTEIDFTSLVRMIPDKTSLADADVEIVPMSEQTRAVTVKALRQPLADAWPTQPVEMITPQEIRRQRREQRLREEELQRKVNARYAQMSEDLRQQWIEEGIIGPDKPQEAWMSKIMDRAIPEQTDEESEEEVVEKHHNQHFGYQHPQISAQERDDLEQALLQRRRSRY